MSHRHDWTRDVHGEGIRAWVCSELDAGKPCMETSATCGTCGKASGSSLLLCERCEAEAHRRLDGIAHALSLWEPDPRSPVKSPGSMSLIPQPGVSRGGLRTPDDVEAELLGWVARWTEHTAPENTGWLGFLGRHIIWAAHNPEQSQWLDFFDDIRRLRTAARRIAGLLPRFMPEPCAHCGGPVVQDRADQEWNPLTGQLPDTVRCLRCGRAWDDPLLFAFANRQHIVEAPDEHPDALVTLEQARMVWPDIPAATMRSWVKRDRDAHQASIDEAIVWHTAWCEYEAAPGEATIQRDEPPDLFERRLPEHGERDGRPLFRLGDLDAAVERWLDDTRRGPKVDAAGQRAAS